MPLLIRAELQRSFRLTKERNLNRIQKTRSSHRICSVNKGVLWNCANITGKYLCWSLFLIKLQALRQLTGKAKENYSQNKLLLHDMFSNAFYMYLFKWYGNYVSCHFNLQYMLCRDVFKIPSNHEANTVGDCFWKTKRWCAPSIIL